MNSIIILGRGESLKKISSFNENIDTVILVNEFWDTPVCPISYYKDELIHNFIKDKKIIIIMSPCCDTSKLNIFVEKYNVISIYKTQFSKKIRVGKSSGNIKILPDILIEPCIYLRKYSKNGGSLTYSILFAKYLLNIKNFYIFGLDFYERDYYLTNNYDYKTEVEKSNLIKKDWMNFFVFNKNLYFNIYTLANLSYKLPNLKIF